MEPPVVHWTPSIAVCGMDFYRGEAFPQWKGNLFISALASERLVRVVLEGERVVDQEVLLQGTGRMRDVRCFEDGAVTVVYDQARQGGGKVVRLVPVER
jgi:glucose/arabinose dehydrogenase